MKKLPDIIVLGGIEFHRESVRFLTDDGRFMSPRVSNVWKSAHYHQLAYRQLVYRHKEWRFAPEYWNRGRGWFNTPEKAFKGYIHHQMEKLYKEYEAAHMKLLAMLMGQSSLDAEWIYPLLTQSKT